MTRGLNVAIYDRSGALVRWRGGTVQRNVRKLRFSTGLPGGFLACDFEMALPTARQWPVGAGYRCVVSLGHDVVWWGWVEDLERRQRGAVEWVSVQALGPWQQVNQRLIAADYVDVNSSYVVRDMLALYCPDLSQDYSQLENSGMPLTIDWEYKSLAELIKVTCAAGNSAGQPLLFAIWEPPGSRVSASAGILNDDPELETNQLYYAKSSDFIYYVATPHVSPRYAWKWTEGVTGGLTHLRRIPVAAGAQYVVDYQLYWTAFSGMSTEARLDWYNASNTLISSTYTTTRTSNGSTTGWQYVSDVVTAPAGAVEVVLGIGGSTGTGGGGGRYFCVDDLRIYLNTTTLAPQTKPRAHLWGRDLSGYDYGLRTAALEDALRLTSTTRDLANWVVAEYGSGGRTGAAQDTTSQGRYRRRDMLLNAGDVAQPEAEAQRDTWLALHASPGQEMAALAVTMGGVLDRRGRPVHPARVRAGDRLRVMDGALAGSVILVEGTEYDAGSGVVRVQPESYTDVSRMLARV